MLEIYVETLLILVSISLVAWIYSVIKGNVSVVDSLWPIFFLIAALWYFLQSVDVGYRQLLVLGLVICWAARLSIYLTIRNFGEVEDRRYQEIRKNNQPNFTLKSLYIVFGLQSALAWIISIPLLIAIYQPEPLSWIDIGAVLLWCVGMAFESIADVQLFRFQRDPANKGKVLDTGVWRYTRHPNYFGECCLWWGFFLLALPAGGWWTVYAPMLMTLLLLKISGIGLMEKGIVERRPEYQAYIRSTNAFFPGLPHR